MRPAPALGPLRARTRRLDADVDLLGVAGAGGLLFEHTDHGLAGKGVALRAPAADAGAVLAAIESDDEVGLPGCGPVAFAALPFVDALGGEVVVPETVVGRAADGTRWVTTVGPASAVPPSPLEEARPAPAGGPPPSTFTVSSPRPVGDWLDAVVEARDAVRAGDLVKVVLAREVTVEADAPIPVVDVLGRLRAAYPGCMRYAIDGLVGASPELLVSRTGDLVRSHPMAGTVPRQGDPTADARLAASLLASEKDRVEHQITIDMVLDTLLPFCSYVDAEAEPSVVAMANVQHLATLCHGRLSSPPATALELAATLHPTPAVAGAPRDAALAAIARLEGMDRGRYAGPVGWVDARGNGTFAVAIRCAEVAGARARLFAGVGVVADSDPEAELAETRAKLQALLSAVVRP